MPSNLFLPLARTGKKLLEDAIPKNTKSSTTQWVIIFELYCRSKKDTDVNFSTIELVDLAVPFESFCADLRRKDGEQYRRNSLMACRSALHRHLSHHRPSVNLFVDGVFSKSNKVLDSVLKAKKKAGSEPAVNHKQHISDDDWKLIQEHFAHIHCAGHTQADNICVVCCILAFLPSRRGSSVQTEEARPAI